MRGMQDAQVTVDEPGCGADQMTASTAFERFRRRIVIGIGPAPAAAKVGQLPANRGDPARTMLFEPHDHVTCANFRVSIPTEVDQMV